VVRRRAATWRRVGHGSCKSRNKSVISIICLLIGQKMTSVGKKIWNIS
jgi:hypothetical protein